MTTNLFLHKLGEILLLSDLFVRPLEFNLDEGQLAENDQGETVLRDTQITYKKYNGRKKKTEFEVKK